MADASYTLSYGADFNQVAVGANSPASAGVELRITSGTSHEEVKRAIEKLKEYVIANRISG